MMTQTAETAGTVPYQGQLLDHEIYRVTLSDRTKAGAKVHELVGSDSYGIESDGSHWWYVELPGHRMRMTKETFGWIDRYLRRTYGLRFRGERPRDD